MDIGTLLVGAFLGVVAKTVEELVRQRLARHTARAAEARTRATDAVDKCYWPAQSHLDDMIASYPSVEEPRRQLRDLFRRVGYLLDPPDAELFWVATSDYAELPDLVRVRDLLHDSTIKKTAAMTQ